MALDQSIDFFLHDTGDKILASGDVKTHLNQLASRADNGGFTAAEFDQLCGVLLKKQMPATICRSFISILVPNQPVSGETLTSLVIWTLSNGSHNIRYLVLPVLHVVNLCVEYDLVADRAPLTHIYEILLASLDRAEISLEIADILAKLTTKADIDDRRVKKVRDCCAQGLDLSRLRWRLRQLRPDLEPNCPPPTASSTRATALHKRYKTAFAARVGTDLNKLGLEPGQLSTRVVFKDGQKESLLPTVESLSFESGLAMRKDNAPELASLGTLEEAYDKLEQIKLPSNILSVVSTKLALNILPRREVIERFSVVLYHTLQAEFLTVPRKRSRAENERRQRRQLRFLEIIRQFQTYCYHGLPVVGRFLSEYLENWDGKQFFEGILGLVKVIQITEFQELYDTVLAQIWAHFQHFSLFNQLLVLDAYFQLLKYWGTREYTRLTRNKPGLFPDAATNCESALFSIHELLAYIDEISVFALQQALEKADTKKDIFADLLTNLYVDTQECFVRMKVPVRLQIPLPLAHDHIFSGSLVAFSKICRYAVCQKSRVLPLLKESVIYHDTLNDARNASIIRQQLHAASLRPLESLTRDLLMVVSPTVVFRREDVVPRTMEAELDLNRLFISNHPAFLPLTVKYFGELSPESGVVQPIFAGLTSERRYSEDQACQMFVETSTSRMSTSVFYRSQAPPETNRINNPELESYLDYLGLSVPELANFLKVFCNVPRALRPAMSIASRHTEVTESSGVSSFHPKRTRKSKADEKELDSPRRTMRTPRSGEKERPISSNKRKQTSDATKSKRTVLSEIN